MRDECAVAAFAIHDEIEEISNAAAAFVEKHFTYEGLGPITDNTIKSAVQQTLINMHRVPDALMSELIKHTREKLKEREQ